MNEIFIHCRTSLRRGTRDRYLNQGILSGGECELTEFFVQCLIQAQDGTAPQETQKEIHVVALASNTMA